MLAQSVSCEKQTVRQRSSPCKAFNEGQHWRGKMEAIQPRCRSDTKWRGEEGGREGGEDVLDSQGAQHDHRRVPEPRSSFQGSTSPRDGLAWLLLPSTVTGWDAMGNRASAWGRTQWRLSVRSPGPSVSDTPAGRDLNGASLHTFHTPRLGGTLTPSRLASERPRGNPW